MNIILFGPPGAGKGTQAKYIVKKLNGFQISTGDILREEIQQNTEIGKLITNDMNDGKFVSDNIVNKLRYINLNGSSSLVKISTNYYCVLTSTNSIRPFCTI